MPYQWLAKDWKKFFSSLEQAKTEEEVKLLCEAEIADWRARPTFKKASSLRVPMTDTRNEIQQQLQGDLQTWALKHLAFSRTEWIAMNAGSDESLQARHEDQQFLKNPDAVVERAIELLSSDRWPDIAAGLAVVTGRRLTELLKTAELTPNSGYSVMFAGQLKSRGAVTFEIPTLAPADLVIDAVSRLRSLLDTTNMDERDVSHRYSQPVRESANQHFIDLVPVRGKHDELYTHLFRSIYARIAVLYYCPMSVTDIHFMATVQGHYKFLESDNETDRRNYASSAHYYDYKLVGPDGNIDGRQGIRLGMDKVELLEVFKPKKKESKEMTPAEIEEQEAKKKTEYSMIKPLKSTRKRFDAAAAGFGLKDQDETLTRLLDIAEQKVSVGQKELTPESLVSEETAVMIRDAMALNNDTFMSFLVDALTKEAKFRLSLSKRHAEKDFTKLTTKELTNTKHPDATKERIRRAIVAIAKYNDQAQSQNDRWYINAKTVQHLVGGRPAIIGEYFKDHQQEIDQENNEYELTAAYNRKAKPINEFVVVPETVE